MSSNYFDIPITLRKRTKYFDLKDRKSERRNLYLNVFFFIELYLKTFGLEFSKLELKRYDGEILYKYDDNQVDYEAKKKAYAIFTKKYTIVETKKEVDENNCILNQQIARDQTNLSARAYDAFRKHLNINTGLKLFTVNKLNVFKKKMNQFFPIKTNSLGVYVDCRDKITFTLKKIHERFLSENKAVENNTFKLHLSGDGCMITTTRLKIINFTFKVLNEGIQNTSGLYTLGNFIKINNHKLNTYIFL